MRPSDWLLTIGALLLAATAMAFIFALAIVLAMAALVVEAGIWVCRGLVGRFD